MKALFDFSFTKYAAPSIAKIVYILIMALIALFYLIAVIGAFSADAVAGLLVLIIVGPLVAILYLVLARVGLESLIATIRTAENTAELVRRGGSSGPSDFGNSGNTGPINPYASGYPDNSTDPRI